MDILATLHPDLHKALDKMQISELTPVQQASVPVMLAGRDMLVEAKTGSGKTLAFALPILQQLDSRVVATKALVLCPTRELAEQVAEQFRLAATFMPNVKVTCLTGGVPMPGQIATLKHPPHIIVGTPGRVVEHLLQKRIKLRDLHRFVLDEADRMLDMGFQDDLQTIVNHLPNDFQSVLFSATYPAEIVSLSEGIQREPERISVDNAHQANKITQIAYKILAERRAQATAAVISHYQPQTAIVFCQTKAESNEVCQYLHQQDIVSRLINGDLSQEQRNEALIQFSQGAARVLVATDVAARGLDIANVELVVNTYLDADIDTHIHRIGRTGRADATGTAVTLVTDEQVEYLARLNAKYQWTLKAKGIESLRFHANRIIPPEFVSLRIDAGKRQKIRPGDILGALTKEAGIAAEDIGNIKVTNQCSYIAVKVRSVKRALAQFREGRIKTKRVRVRRLH